MLLNELLIQMNEPYYKEIENKMNISHNQLD